MTIRFGDCRKSNCHIIALMCDTTITTRMWKHLPDQWRGKSDERQSTITKIEVKFISMRIYADVFITVNYTTHIYDFRHQTTPTNKPQCMNFVLQVIDIQLAQMKFDESLYSRTMRARHSILFWVKLLIQLSIAFQNDILINPKMSIEWIKAISIKMNSVSRAHLFNFKKQPFVIL